MNKMKVIIILVLGFLTVNLYSQDRFNIEINSKKRSEAKKIMKSYLSNNYKDGIKGVKYNPIYCDADEGTDLLIQDYNSLSTEQDSLRGYLKNEILKGNHYTGKVTFNKDEKSYELTFYFKYDLKKYDVSKPKLKN